MKFRWYIDETDNGPHRPSGPPYTMSLGHPWRQFTRTEPRLQQFTKGEWQDIPFFIVRKKSQRLIEDEKKMQAALKNFRIKKP